jgi:hypothetical protein
MRKCVLEITSGFLNADPLITGFKAFTPVTPNGFKVRAAKGRLLQAWSENQLPNDFQRITSPNLHDQKVALTFPVQNSSELVPLLQWNDVSETMFPNDQLTIEGTNASAFTGVMINTHLLIYYPEYRDSETNFISYSEYKRRFKHYLLNKVHITPDPALVGFYSGERAINADSDPFVYTSEYALLGANIVANTFGCIGVRSPDWGGFRIGIPGQSQMFYGVQNSLNWFPFLSRLFDDLPCIPVVSPANRGATIVDVTANNVVPSDIIFQFAQLEKA